jgi:hypothetical protein
MRWFILAVAPVVGAKAQDSVQGGRRGRQPVEVAEPAVRSEKRIGEGSLAGIWGHPAEPELATPFLTLAGREGGSWILAGDGTWFARSPR